MREIERKGRGGDYVYGRPGDERGLGTREDKPVYQVTRSDRLR